MTSRKLCERCGRSFFPRDPNYVMCLSCAARELVEIRDRLMATYEDCEDRLPHINDVRCGRTERAKFEERSVDSVSEGYCQQVVEMCGGESA